MHQRRQEASYKAALVLFGCFCIGILATRLVVNLYIADPVSKPSDAPQTSQKVEPTSREKALANSSTLVSVILPPPPSIQRAAAAQQNTQRADSSKRASAQSKENPLDSHQIDTQQSEVLQQGLAWLKHSQQQDAPQIRIDLPTGEQQREQVINTLRACMGVTLGKVSEQGEVLAQEIAGTSFSPFLRLVEGKLTKQEQQIARSWRHAPGSIVRFYPESADAKVLGGLLQLARGRIAHKKITGEYSLQGNSLTLVNIKINGKTQQTELRLSESC